MPQNPDQGSDAPVTADLLTVDDAAFNEAIGLDIGTEADAPAQDQPRDAQGRFITDAIAEDVGTEAAAEPTEAEAAAAASAEPEAEPAAEPVAEEKPKPLTPFTVRNEAGEETDAPPVLLTFKAGGKEHVDVPLDKVVRWAQSGFHVEQVTREADEVRQRLPVIEQEMNTVRLALEDQKILNQRLLEDEEFFVSAREQYALHNTPEHKLAREREALASQRAALEQRELATEAQAFLRNVTAPKIAQMREQYPTVTEEEIVTRLMMELTPLQRNGRVPREQWTQVSSLLDERVAAYAAAQHEIRDGYRATAKVQEKQTVVKAQEEATKAKRQLARAIAPTTSRTAAPPARVVNSIESAADSIVDDVVNLIANGG